MSVTAQDACGPRKMLRVTLAHSAIGSPRTQRATVQALGLGKLHKTVLLPDNPQVRGMVRKVVHLVEVVEVIEPGGTEKAAEAGGGGAAR